MNVSLHVIAIEHSLTGIVGTPSRLPGFYVPIISHSASSRLHMISVQCPDSRFTFALVVLNRGIVMCFTL